MELPQGFIKEIRTLLPGEADAFLEAMEAPAQVSVKLNRRKCSDSSLLGYGELGTVPWCGSGRYLPERPRFTLNPLLHAGAFYVQDASSMIYEEITRRVLGMMQGAAPQPAVADLCAAPGGKTTSIINALPDGALVVANEYTPQRRRALVENLTKWGYPGFIATGNATRDFRRLGAAFDIVAVDAPCSGEGMMRKEPEAVAQWSPGLVASCAALQREILGDAAEILKPGGFLIYSTCTFNRTENEEQLEWLAGTHGMTPVDPAFPDEWGIMGGIGTSLPCFRFMPHRTRGEGLFVAVLRKDADGSGRVTSRRNLHTMITSGLRVLADGIPETCIRGRDILPAPTAPLAVDFDNSRTPVFDADEKTALSFLRHEALCLPDYLPKGPVVISYRGIPLGLVKNLGRRANNLYPPEWRIRNL